MPTKISSYLTELGFRQLTHLSDAPSYNKDNAGEFIVIKENSRSYRYEANSDLPVDNNTVLPTLDGGNTRWLSIGGASTVQYRIQYTFQEAGNTIPLGMKVLYKGQILYVNVNNVQLLSKNYDLNSEKDSVVLVNGVESGTSVEVVFFVADFSIIADYELLSNKPQINGVELIGDKSLDDLGIQETGDYARLDQDNIFTCDNDFTGNIKLNGNMEVTGNVDFTEAETLVASLSEEDRSQHPAPTEWVKDLTEKSIEEALETTYTREEIDQKIEDKDSLPPQPGEDGKWLQTNGTSASWEDLPIATDEEYGLSKLASEEEFEAGESETAVVTVKQFTDVKDSLDARISANESDISEHYNDFNERINANLEAIGANANSIVLIKETLDTKQDKLTAGDHITLDESNTISFVGDLVPARTDKENTWLHSDGTDYAWQALPEASDSLKGIIKIASADEIEAGTSTNSAVVVKQLQDVVDNLSEQIRTKDGLPDRTGNEGKFLYTDGIGDSWESLPEATQTIKGIVKLASEDEITAATSTTSVVVVSQLKKVETDLNTEIAKKADKALDFVTPITAENKGVTMKELRDSETTSLTFKGFVGTVEPDENELDLFVGNLWINSAVMPEDFPVSKDKIKVYDGDNWIDSEEEYSPAAFDAFRDMETNEGYYWFGGEWVVMSTDLSTTDFELGSDGKWLIKDNVELRGLPTVAANPQTALGIATKGYVDTNNALDEKLINKATSLNDLFEDDTKYPSAKATKSYVDSSISTLDGNVVHKTGDETITNVKTFINTIVRKSEAIDINTLPTSTTRSNIDFKEKNDTIVGQLGIAQTTAGSIQIYVNSYNGTSWGDELGTGIKLDGTKYTFAHTPANDSDDNNIATTEWVNDRIVEYAPTPESTSIYQLMKPCTDIIKLEDDVTIYNYKNIAPASLVFDVSELKKPDDRVITFELYVVTNDEPGEITWPDVIWVNREEPHFIANSSYLFAFRSFDKGNKWLGNIQCNWEGVASEIDTEALWKLSEHSNRDQNNNGIRVESNL